MTDQPAADQPQPHADEPQRPTPRLVPARRRPNAKRFLVTAALLGLVLGAVVGYLGPSAAQSTRGQEVVMLATVGAIFGLLAGAVAYLIADRASESR